MSSPRSITLSFVYADADGEFDLNVSGVVTVMDSCSIVALKEAVMLALPIFQGLSPVHIVLWQLDPLPNVLMIFEALLQAFPLADWDVGNPPHGVVHLASNFVVSDYFPEVPDPGCMHLVVRCHWDLDPRNRTEGGHGEEMPDMIRVLEGAGYHLVTSVLDHPNVILAYHKVPGKSGLQYKMIKIVDCYKNPAELTIIGFLRVLETRGNYRNHSVPFTLTDVTPAWAYITMPFYEESLDETLPEKPELCLPLARQLCDGVQYLHDNGIAHCDLKTEHLALHGNRLVILDFGLALRVSGVEHTVKDSRGTLGWVAPELLTNGYYSPILADRWAVGEVIWRSIAPLMQDDSDRQRVRSAIDMLHKNVAVEHSSLALVSRVLSQSK